jgi:HEAT repeat protein
MYTDSQLSDLRIWHAIAVSGDAITLGTLTNELLKAVLNKTVSKEFLQQLVLHSEVRVREHGMWIISELGEAAASLLPDCIRGLQDVSANVRHHACATIDALGDKAVEASFADIVQLLLDTDATVRHAGVSALLTLSSERFHECVSRQRTRLNDRSLLFKLYACLDSRSAADDCFEPLIACLCESDRSLRLAAIVSALHQGRRSVGVLARAMQHDDNETRCAAVRFSAHLGKVIAPILIDHIQSESSDKVRANALFSLASIPNLSLESSRIVIKSQLLATQSEIRLGALQVMTRMLPLNQLEVKAVIDRLTDEDLHVRSQAGMLLSNISSRDRESLDPFIDQLFGFLVNDESDSDICQVRSDILYAIGNCSPELLTPQVEKRTPQIALLLDDKSDQIVSRSLFILSRCAQIPKSLFEKTREIEESTESTEVRRMAERVLTQHAS